MLIVLLCVLGLLVLSIGAALLFPRQVLCVDSGEVRADAMVVLGGGAYERPQRAAELFKAGVAPKIVVSGGGDAYVNKTLLVANGVPEGAVVMEARSNTTRENATCTVPLLRAMGAHRVVIVTSWYHSRRALKTFQKTAPEIQFYSRPAYYGADRKQWSREGLKRLIRIEYSKLLGYWVYYGVCPF